MQTFDWIVVGNGLAGAALSYELARQGLAVLLIDQALSPASGTRYSYGGIPYWSGTTALTRQLCQEGWARHQVLSEELETDTELRELDLLLTLPIGAEIDAIAAQYSQFATPPSYLPPEAACRLEPQLNPAAIAGAFTVPHAHVNPQRLVRAYNQGFTRLGGTIRIAPVTGLVRIGDRVTGVTTPEQALASHQVAIAAGAYSRALLREVGIRIPLYYTHAELVETPPVDFQIQTLVMPASTQRFSLEAQISSAEQDSLWDESGHEVAPSVLDSGVIQFQDGSLRLGQISRALTDLEAVVDAEQSEQAIRQAIAQQLPVLEAVPGTWHRCLVSFCRDGLPLVGSLPGVAGVHLFTGFSSPFALLPPVAVRFAHWATGQPDALIEQMQPARFQETVAKL